MANEKQLRILQEEDVRVWNEWRNNNPNIRIDLRDADLSLANLTGANLTGADLSRANLTLAYLYDADLNGADLSAANIWETDLRHAKLRDANLRNANLHDANLSDTNLSRAKLNGARLIEADLHDADLSGADLSNACLRDANLHDTDLRDADLQIVQALATNFRGATLTGACIEDWNINSETNLENVICDYIYLKKDKGERRPSDPNRNFEPGEFAKLVGKSIETIDLIFTDGIDWRAFLSSFQDLRVEYGEQNVSIQAIEKKSDGAFVIRLNVPSDVDKAEIEESFWQTYRPILQAKDSQIALYGQELEYRRKENTKLLNIVQTMAEKDNISNEFHAPVGSVGNKGTQTNVAGTVQGNQIGTQYNSPQKPTLAEAADEIQKLLQQLEQTNPTATPEQQQAYVDAAIPPTLKERCIGALPAEGETAIEEFLDNPYVNVGKAVVMAWMKP